MGVSAPTMVLFKYKLLHPAPRKPGSPLNFKGNTPLRILCSILNEGRILPEHSTLFNHKEADEKEAGENRINAKKVGEPDRELGTKNFQSVQTQMIFKVPFFWSFCSFHSCPRATYEHE